MQPFGHRPQQMRRLPSLEGACGLVVETWVGSGVDSVKGLMIRLQYQGSLE